MVTFTGKYKIKRDNILFFDLDGTLVETNYANFLAYKASIEAVTERKCTITYNPNARFTRASLITEFPDLTNDEIIKIITIKESEYWRYLHETELNKEVFDILRIYHEANDCVLVTNSHKERAKMILKFYKMTYYFADIIFHNNESPMNKYRKAIDQLKIPPETIVLYEDNGQEIRNAKGVGIRVINPILIEDELTLNLK